ncbi:melanocortin-2 receptor accessory protein 2A-like isoform X2 [Myripristis murdjan]|uniref:melanocortin-2 receptor accessory protein 2A-like isoform X2 n=1 Tax=Myripristis murdjan TaxID=586833 RepID=UPI001175C89F|nr:melanocortin-2 receptor accessory protein 2A-like isoform X2 [Myripristis murdjan]
MSDFHNQSQASARRSDYVWQYEYYDDEEPVSFEGLKAHRYSIVIGFWVGLAVFVIFMFFVLTLLTKTGAPHQENPEHAEKHHRPGSCLADNGSPQDENERAFSRPLLPESRSFFHFYISEEEQGQGKCKAEDQGGEESEERQPLQGLVDEGKSDRESAFLSHFNIPNFVNLEHSSTLGEDDLLLCEPSAMLGSQSRSQDAHRNIN